jgi:hypothetical protein
VRLVVVCLDVTVIQETQGHVEDQGAARRPDLDLGLVVLARLSGVNEDEADNRSRLSSPTPSPINVSKGAAGCVGSIAGSSMHWADVSGLSMCHLLSGQLISRLFERVISQWIVNPRVIRTFSKDQRSATGHPALGQDRWCRGVVETRTHPWSLPSGNAVALGLFETPTRVGVPELPDSPEGVNT